MASPSHPPALPPSGLIFRNPDLALGNDIVKRYHDFLLRPSSNFVRLNVTNNDKVERFLVVLFGTMITLAPWMECQVFWRDVSQVWLNGKMSITKSDHKRTEGLVDAVLKARGIDYFYDSTASPAQTRLGRLIDHWAELVRDPSSFRLLASDDNLSDDAIKAYRAAHKSLTGNIRKEPLDVFSGYDIKQDKNNQSTEMPQEEAATSASTASVLGSPTFGSSSTDTVPKAEYVAAQSVDADDQFSEDWGELQRLRKQMCGFGQRKRKREEEESKLLEQQQKLAEQLFELQEERKLQIDEESTVKDQYHKAEERFVRKWTY